MLRNGLRGKGLHMKRYNVTVYVQISMDFVLMLFSSQFININIEYSAYTYQ